MQLFVDKVRHRTTQNVRELQQAQQELWALRGASPTGPLTCDLEQDLLVLKKKVMSVFLNFHSKKKIMDLFDTTVGNVVGNFN